MIKYYIVFLGIKYKKVNKENIWWMMVPVWIMGTSTWRKGESLSNAEFWTTHQLNQITLKIPFLCYLFFFFFFFIIKQHVKIPPIILLLYFIFEKYFIIKNITLIITCIIWKDTEKHPFTTMVENLI